MSDQKTDKMQRPTKPDLATRAPAPPAPETAPQPTSRAAAILRVPEAGAPLRAEASTDLQQTLGNARVGEMVEKPADAPRDSMLVQRQAATAQAPTQSSAPSATNTSPTPAYITPALKQKFAATILAESHEGQESDIRWVYYNRVTKAQGETGLKGSSAYARKSIWYKIWLYMLGDQTYANTALPKQSQFKGFATVEAFCSKNGFMQTTGAERARKVQALVDEMFNQPSNNPHTGWIGQGNLPDFNNVSRPNSRYWKQARAYYWLQERGEVQNIYVKVLPAGKNTQFIFDAISIERYYRTHPLPEHVPVYIVSK